MALWSAVKGDVANWIADGGGRRKCV